MSNVKAQPRKRSAKTSKGTTTLLLIGIFKLVKGILLIGVAIGALGLLHRDVAETVTHWIRLLRIDPENSYLHGVLSKIFRVTPKQLQQLSVGTFIYACLFLTEGTGLLLRKRWAEYFTIFTTGGLIPLELYEISKHPTAAKFVLLALNVAMVVYLVVRVRREAK